MAKYTWLVTVDQEWQFRRYMVDLDAAERAMDSSGYFEILDQIREMPGFPSDFQVGDDVDVITRPPSKIISDGGGLSVIKPN